MDSGFQFDKASEREYTITDSDEYLIRGINGKKACEEYCKIIHMRPYFINMLQKLNSNSNVVKLFRKLSQASETLYTGIRNAMVKPFGTEFIRGNPEMLVVLEVDEKEEIYILTQSYKAKGTKLKKLKNYPEEQLAVYDNLYDKVSNSGGVIICSCAMRPLWYNFNYKALEEKIGKFNCPIMVSHVFTELGTELPYEENRNLIHSGVIKALVFK
ncbi:MAG: hypothetical protein B6U72_00315 [Candidatus Altiarchaeales archaeon ex4484_2]|nr:MAG: hypothetical protein B6U72_00315 [Candidatus Altiarchaeales archaeon ex4484_2]